MEIAAVVLIKFVSVTLGSSTMAVWETPAESHFVGGRK